MESLIKSGDPLLILAGALFLVGVCFDLIFSKEFKAKIRESIASPAGKRNSSKNLIITYAGHLVTEILNPRRPGIFFLKTCALSILFYSVIVLLDAKYNLQVGGFADVQHGLLSDLIEFSYPVVAVFATQIMFDWLSAYISILYFRLVTICKRAVDIAVVLFSDIFVTAALWSIFFTVALAMHLMLADQTQRTTTVSAKINESSTSREEFNQDSFVFTNKTLTTSQSVKAEVAFYEPESGFHSPPNNAITFLSNMNNKDTVAQIIFNLPGLGNSTYSVVSPPAKIQPDTYTSAITVTKTLGLSDFIFLTESALRYTSPLDVLFGEGGYFATRRGYLGVVEQFRNHLYWSGPEAVLYCDGALRKIQWSELKQFNFTQCSNYLVTDSATGQYLALIAGNMLVRNTRIAYRAFFWSSMALTLAFYLIFFALSLRRLLAQLLAKQISQNVFNFEKAFFTPLFCVISVSLLMIFIVKTVIRGLAT